MMNPARRNFLLGAAAAVGAASHVKLLAQPDPAARNRLRIPELIDARRQGQAIALEARFGRSEFFPGQQSLTMGYNGSYLGPTLRMQRGDDVEVAVSNSLDQDTTVHWHGLLVPGDRDGGPHQNIVPGTTWRPVLPVRQPGATLFYHSHAHGRTGEQVYAGLAGMLLVHDPREDALGLPSEYGVDDLPLVIQDRQFAGGRLVEPAGMMSVMHGRRGNTLLVNGTANAEVRVPVGTVRLRLVNASNARTYLLAFDDRRAFHWIASDGGLLPAPVTLRSLSLAAGERAEILVDFSDGKAAQMVSGPDTGMPMMGGMIGRREAPADETVLAFVPVGPAQQAAQLPARLGVVPAADAGTAVRRRRLTLEMGMAGMGRMGAMHGGGFSISGKPFDMQRVDHRVRLGDTEIWEVSGDMMVHPFHVHGVHFQVLSRNGHAPTLRDQGLRDTVVVGEPVELLMRFTQPSGRAPFMYHCHILEHEDAGMMGQFTTA